jgi:DNA mismatch repair protein MutL
VYQFVQRTVRERLHAADLTARMQLQTRKEYQPGSDVKAPSHLPPATRPAAPSAREQRPASAEPKEMSGAARSTVPPAPLASLRSPAAFAEKNLPHPVMPAEMFYPLQDTVEVGPVPGQRETTEPARKGQGDVLNAIQVLDCYLVVDMPPDEIWFIDQHALHEAILFEQWQQRIRSGALETQRLLIPEAVNLPSIQAARVLEHAAELSELGLAVEDFGGGTVLLTSYPVLLGKRSPTAVLLAVIDHLVTQEGPPSREQLLNDLLSVMACHAAVRAGDRLSAEEIAALVARCDLAENSHHCPHGRPTTFRLSRRELDRKFRRL